MADIRGPDNTKRTIVLGRTGAGKSVMAFHLLSYQNFDVQPWVIIDYKGEILANQIASICRLKVISVNDPPPKKPGLYIMRPTPIIDDAAMEKWLWAVWKQENIGLFIDEGYTLPQKAAFDVILTQGRSKHIPVIALYQRPVYMSRFAVAQADFFAVFDQNDERDLKTTRSFIKPAVLADGTEVTVFSELDEYSCLWYDVGRGKTAVLKPSPDSKTILGKFRHRLNPASHKTGAFA